MLVKIRRGVFETNSSSTHAFSIKKIDEPAEPAEWETEIKFKIVSLDHKFLFLYGVIKCFYNDYGGKEVNDLLETLIQVYANSTNKKVEEVTAFIKAEEEKDRYTCLCARYFNNDCLAECSCFTLDHKHYDVFAKLFFNVSNDYKEGLEKILSDNYYIDLTEFWAGGIYAKENIDY